MRSFAKTAARAPSETGLVSRIFTGHEMYGEASTLSTVRSRGRCAYGFDFALPMFLIATSAISSSVIPYRWR
jgi:hypothetical protein